MAAALDQHAALALAHDFLVLVHAPMAEMHDAGVLAIRWAGRQHLGERIESIAVEHRMREADLVERELGERILGGVLRGKPDDQRERHAAESEALAEAVGL